MNKARSVLLIMLVFILAVPVMAVTAFYIIPASAIEGLVERSLSERFSVRAEMKGINKVFPLGVRTGEIVFKDATTGDVHLSIDDAWAELDPLRLFTGTVAIDYKVSLSGGLAEGTVAAGVSGTSIDMNLKRVSIFMIPALERLRLASVLPFDGAVSLALPKRGCLTGEIDLSASAQGASELRYSGLPLPIGKVGSAVIRASFLGPSSKGEGEGADQISGACVLAIKKITSKTSELEAEVAGDLFYTDSLDTSRVDMYLEIRPEERLLEKEYILSLIKAHRRDDGSYRILIKGPLKEAFTR